MKALFTATLLALTLQMLAVDRIVEEFGQAPAFSSITAAVNAAEDGDRIIIKNRAGNIPWIEDISIDKSLQFLSFANDDFFVVQGNYTVQFVSGLEVAFVGMRNTSGSIGQGSAASGNRLANVSIMDSWLQDGGISFSSNYFDVQVVGNQIDNGSVRIGIGNIIGNDVSGANLDVSLVWINNSSSPFLGDTCLVVGNRFDYLTSASSEYCVRVSTNQQVVHIKNNFVKYSTRGIDISGGITAAIPNQVWNNTLLGQSSFSTTTSYGMRLFATGNNSIWEVMGNVIVRGTLNMSNRHALSVSSPGGQANAYYNHVSNGFTSTISSGWTFEDLNEVNQTIEINAQDGSLSEPSSAVDGGNPAPLFYDLDLSPNDAGCWGGSYSHQNFFPLHTGAARVYNVLYPFNVRVGNTLNVKAFSFDR